MATLSAKPKDRIPDGFTDMVRRSGQLVEMLRPDMGPSEFRAVQLMAMAYIRRVLSAYPGGDAR
jgi:hypothetical protein